MYLSREKKAFLNTGFRHFRCVKIDKIPSQNQKKFKIRDKFCKKDSEGKEIKFVETRTKFKERPDL